MAIIKFRECNKDISDQAPACPQCGCPVRAINSELPQIKPTTIIMSRWGLLLGGSFTEFIFPKSIKVEGHSLQTKKVRFFLFPWWQQYESMTGKKIASVRHAKGFIWDKVIIETYGGSNDLNINGLRKKDAKKLLGLLESLSS